MILVGLRMPNCVSLPMYFGDEFDIGSFLIEFGLSVADLTVVLLYAPNGLFHAIRAGSVSQIKAVLQVGSLSIYVI